MIYADEKRNYIKSTVPKIAQVTDHDSYGWNKNCSLCLEWLFFAMKCFDYNEEKTIQKN